MEQIQVEVYEVGEIDIYEKNVFDKPMEALRYMKQMSKNFHLLSHFEVKIIVDGDSIDCEKFGRFIRLIGDGK